MTRKVRGGRARLFGFHSGFQTSITQRHPAALTRRAHLPKCLYWMLLGDAGADLGGLKIRVSVVRFRPWPPLKSETKPRTQAPGRTKTGAPQ